jgi:hypothetical protein
MKFIIYISIILSIASCDTAKKAIKHHNKAEALGYVYKCDPVTVTLRDTIKGKDGKDSIVEVFVKVPCPKAEPPKTRWEIRHMAKAERDSMEHVENVLNIRNKMLEDSLSGLLKIKKEDTKQVKSDNKTEGKINKPFPWGILLIVIGLLFIFVSYVIYKFKK